MREKLSNRFRKLSLSLLSPKEHIIRQVQAGFAKDYLRQYTVVERDEIGLTLKEIL